MVATLDRYEKITESSRKTTITWDDLRNEMLIARISSSIIPSVMIDHFEKSSLKFYGYGSRFNGSNPRDNSDWDMLVVCNDKQWIELKLKLGMELYEWECPIYEGHSGPKQPVFCNYKWVKDKTQSNKHAINVRRINNPETDLYSVSGRGEWILSKYTEIILPKIPKVDINTHRQLLANAFTAYQLAINCKLINIRCDKSIGELADQYGKDITTPKHLEEVGNWFKYSKFTKYWM